VEFFRNITLNLNATGRAAVLIVLIMSIAVLGIFGSSTLGAAALGLLAGSGSLIIKALGSRV
jgi:hypothetical protein